MGPWEWLNYIFPGALPIFFRMSLYWCSLPHFTKPKLMKGSNTIWLSVLYTLTGNSVTVPSSQSTLTISVSFFNSLHRYLIFAVMDKPGAISGCILYKTLKLGFSHWSILILLDLWVKFLISTVISYSWLTSMSLNTTSAGIIYNDADFDYFCYILLDRLRIDVLRSFEPCIAFFLQAHAFLL